MEGNIDITAAALEVLLRRDMSLNRRLYAWLLGANAGAETTLSRTDSVCSGDEHVDHAEDTFFNVHSRQLVVEAVKKVFHSQGAAPAKGDRNGSRKSQRLEVLKPYRLLISLLDKPEIGGSILEDVLVDVFRALYNQCKILKENGAAFEETDNKDSIESVAAVSDSSKTKLIDELIKTANVLFNAFEPSFMWEYIADLLSECGRPPQGAQDVNGFGEGKQKNGELKCKLPATTCSELFRLADFILDVVALVSQFNITVALSSRCRLTIFQTILEHSLESLVIGTPRTRTETMEGRLPQVNPFG